MTIEERLSTAIHEAGHVIVGWTLGLPVGAIEIGIYGDDTAGKSEIADAGSHGEIPWARPIFIGRS
jgi:hypothetical protein